jgi:hypothetical protein
LCVREGFQQILEGPFPGLLAPQWLMVLGATEPSAEARRAPSVINEAEASCPVGEGHQQEEMGIWGQAQCWLDMITPQ